MNKKDGFTLIEVLISTAVMVSVLTALVYGLNQTSQLAETLRNQDIAINANQEKLEEIANSDLSQLPSSYNGRTFTVDVDGFNNPLNQSLEPIDHGQVTVTPVGGSPNLFDVSVTVTWRQRGREISRSIDTTLGRR